MAGKGIGLWFAFSDSRVSSLTTKPHKKSRTKGSRVLCALVCRSGRYTMFRLILRRERMRSGWTSGERGLTQTCVCRTTGTPASGLQKDPAESEEAVLLERKPGAGPTTGWDVGSQVAERRTINQRVGCRYRVQQIFSHLYVLIIVSRCETPLSLMLPNCRPNLFSPESSH